MLINPYILAPASSFTPVTGISQLVAIGTSIEYQAFDAATDAAKAYLASMLNGQVIDVVNYGQTGATTQTIRNAYFNTQRAALLASSAGAAGTMIIVNSLPNSITQLMPYASATAGQLALHRSYWDEMVNDMRATFGANKVLIMGTVYRDTNRDFSRAMDESLGSWPFNPAWVNPQSETSNQLYLGEPWIAPYNLGFNWGAPLMNDDTHFNILGSQMLCQYYLDGAIAAIKGVAPPRIPKKATPWTDTKPRSAPAWVQYTNAANVYRSANFLGATIRGYNYTDAIPYLCGALNYEPSLGLKARPAISSGSQTGLGTGNTSRSVLNDAFRLSYQFSTSTTWVLVDTFTNITPNTICDVDIMACRVNSGSLITEYSFDAVNVAGEIEAARTAGQIPNWIRVQATSSSAGELPLYMRRKTGNGTAGYINVVYCAPRG